jgi:excisionase family DNA binding protein
MSGDRLLDAQEVAELLNVPVGWVREHTRNGALPVVTLGRYRRYLEADVRAWVESCRTPGRPVTFRKQPPGTPWAR